MPVPEEKPQSAVLSEGESQKKRRLIAAPLTAEAFAPYGDVIEAVGPPDILVNRGRSMRYHNRTKLDCLDGAVGMSLHLSEKREAPFQINSVARHPEGSQAYIPMAGQPYLITVAEDENNQPSQLVAFVASPHQAINYHRNIWHGVLTPLGDPGLFAVIDYVGSAPNMEDFWFDQPYFVGIAG